MAILEAAEVAVAEVAVAEVAQAAMLQETVESFSRAKIPHFLTYPQLSFTRAHFVVLMLLLL